VLFTVDCNGAVSALNNQLFTVINTVHMAGGTPPLQWPDLGWPNAQIDQNDPCSMMEQMEIQLQAIKYSGYCNLPCIYHFSNTI